MGYVEETEVRTVLRDQSRVDEIIPTAIEDPEAMSELAEDVADELEDLLEGDGASWLLYESSFMSAISPATSQDL